jgi:formamidopyrimidine-DNA glycosylase
LPELPEVETVRRGLERQVVGFEIARVEVRRARAIAAPPEPVLFCAALEGCRVEAWKRRGKYLLAELSQEGQDAGHWGVHLRMTGQFLWMTDAQPPCSHTRVQIWNRNGQELRFVDTRSFGEMWWVPPGAPLESVITGLKKLGPEPFSNAFDPSYLKSKLAGSIRPIKNALLDQALVAGVGNIYADESLFMSGIAPHTPSGRIGRPKLRGCTPRLSRYWKPASAWAVQPSATFATSPAPTATTATRPGCIAGAANLAGSVALPSAATSSVGAAATGAPVARAEQPSPPLASRKAHRRIPQCPQTRARL